MCSRLKVKAERLMGTRSARSRLTGRSYMMMHSLAHDDEHKRQMLHMLLPRICQEADTVDWSNTGYLCPGELRERELCSDGSRTRHQPGGFWAYLGTPGICRGAVSLLFLHLSLPVLSLCPHSRKQFVLKAEGFV